MRHGDPAAETLRLAGETGADGLTLPRDASGYARRRWQRLEPNCREHRIALHKVHSVTVVPPGDLTPHRRRPLQGIHPRTGVRGPGTSS